MKIIKPGRKQQGWAKEFICTGKGLGEGGCNAVLLVEQPDLYFIEHDKTRMIAFACPACGTETRIEISKYMVDKIIGKATEPKLPPQGETSPRRAMAPLGDEPDPLDPKSVAERTTRDIINEIAQKYDELNELPF